MRVTIMWGPDDDYEVMANVSPGSPRTYNDPGCGPEVEILRIVRVADGEEIHRDNWAAEGIDHAAERDIEEKAIHEGARELERQHDDAADQRRELRGDR